MSPTTSSQTLLQFLRHEISAIDAPQPQEVEPCLPAGDETSPLRVPIELAGVLWCAEVEQIDRDQISLIVDRQAVRFPDDRIEAVIHYQPENSAMRHTSGTATPTGFLPHNRVRLNFDLR